MIKNCLIYLLILFSSKLYANRVLIGAFQLEPSSSDYETAYGGYLASEKDIFNGFFSLGQYVSYYEAQARGEGGISNLPTYSSEWMSDISISGYNKFRLPSSKRFFSVYASIGLGLHLAYRQLNDVPSEFKSNWAPGWNYGVGAELRLGRLNVEAKINYEEVFGADYHYIDNSYYLLALGYSIPTKGVKPMPALY